MLWLMPDGKASVAACSTRPYRAVRALKRLSPHAGISQEQQGAVVLMYHAQHLAIEPSEPDSRKILESLWPSFANDVLFGWLVG